MSFQYVEVIDSKGNIVATANVKDEGKYYSGKINIDQMPVYLRLKLEEYENIVNEQVFSLLDEIEKQIELNLFQIILVDGTRLNVYDVQIFPGSKTISFKKYFDKERNSSM